MCAAELEPARASVLGIGGPIEGAVRNRRTMQRHIRNRCPCDQIASRDASGAYQGSCDLRVAAAMTDPRLATQTELLCIRGRLLPCRILIGLFHLLQIARTVRDSGWSNRRAVEKLRTAGGLEPVDTPLQVREGLSLLHTELKSLPLQAGLPHQMFTKHLESLAVGDVQHLQRNHGWLLECAEVRGSAG